MDIQFIGKGFIPPGWGIGGTRGGEDDDDDTQDPNEPPSGAYALQCPAATRGSTGRCTVHVPDDVTPATLRYQWSSDKGDTKSGGAEANFWDGTATSTANVTVRVTDASGTEVFSDTQPVTVVARQTYRPAHLYATPYFRNRSYMNGLSPNSPRDKVAGAYTLPEHDPSPPTAARGSGPWADEYYAQAPPDIPTLLHIVSDYNSDTANRDVGRYPGGNSTCPSSSSNVVNQAAYYDVNYYCGTWTAADAFRLQIISHERDHEKGYEACIKSNTATTHFNAMEPLVSSEETSINNSLAREWNAFYGKFKKAGKQANARFSANVFWQNYGSWVKDLEDVTGEGGAFSC